MRSMKGRIDHVPINQRTTQSASQRQFKYYEYELTREPRQKHDRYIAIQEDLDTMDPDGDYESLHSARSLGGAILKNAKLDGADESDKKCGCSGDCGDDGFDNLKGKDEEMGLKPSPKVNSSKAIMAEEKEGSVDFKPSAPPVDDLGCLPSAPPLEPSLHPSPEDDATAPPTPESSHPPEPPGFKDDPIEGGNYIPDSVALPIGLDNADRALPVASVVPIITDATGAEGAHHPIIQPSEESPRVSGNIPMNQATRTSTTRDTARRVPSFFRQSSTHPAPADELSANHSAEATLANPQHLRDERDKSEGQGSKCTSCKRIMATVLVAAICVGVAVGLTTKSNPVEHNYPNCHVSHPDWIGDGFCNGGQYNKKQCGWDGGDCFERNWPGCHVSYSEWIGDGFCNGGQYNTAECGWDGGDCLDDPDIITHYPNCNVQNPNKIKDGNCDGGQYNTEDCGWDGGDCVVEGYPNCHGIQKPQWIGDGTCDGGKYNTRECGWDGGDCPLGSYPLCEVQNPNKIDDGNCDGGDYNTDECGWDGGDCLVADWPDCHVDNLYKLGNGNCDGGQYNTEECGWDGGDCMIPDWPNCHVDSPEKFGNGRCNYNGGYNTAQCGFDGGDCGDVSLAEINDFTAKYPNCQVDAEHFSWIGDGTCCRNCGDMNNAECGWDGGDCLDFNGRYPDCHVDLPHWIGDGSCDGGQYNTPECGYDGGDCVHFNREARYPNCEAQSMHRLNDDFCDWYSPENRKACGWDGGDCLFTRYYGQACNGSTSSTRTDKTRAWCQAKCVDEGSNCKAYDFSTTNDRCRIFSSFSSSTSRNNSICWKKKNPDCNVQNLHWLNDGTCDSGNYNKVACGWDGGDCRFHKFNDKACIGSVRSTWTNKRRAWCQEKCMEEGNSCKAYDFSWKVSSFRQGTCRIFSSYSSTTTKNNSRCYKKK